MSSCKWILLLIVPAIAKSVLRASQRYQRLTQSNTDDTLQLVLAQEDEESQADHCRGQRYTWQFQVNKKCRSRFGPESVWNIKQGSGGYCLRGWHKCITSYYVQCCTDPVGPKFLNDYCTLLGDQDRSAEQKDQACGVQPTLGKIDKDLKKLTNLFDEVSESNSSTLPKNDRMLTAALMTTTSTLTTTTSEIADDAEEAPSPATGPAPAPQAAPAAAPSSTIVEEPASPSPAGPAPAGLPAPASPEIVCEEIDELKAGILGEVTNLQIFLDAAEKDNTKATDPELVTRVQQLVQVANQISIMNPICEEKPETDTDDDDGDDSEEDESNEVVVINNAAVISMTTWVNNLRGDLFKTYTEVHPHYLVWWRYPYQYSILECVILIPAIIWVHLACFTLRQIDPTLTHIKSSTNLGVHILRNCASQVFGLMTMGAGSWMLNYYGFFDWLATSLREHQAGPWRTLLTDPIPYVGISWYIMVQDVMYYLFGMFGLFTLLCWAIVSRYQTFHTNTALEEAQADRTKFIEDIDKLQLVLVKGFLDVVQKSNDANLKPFEHITGRSPKLSEVSKKFVGKNITDRQVSMTSQGDRWSVIIPKSRPFHREKYLSDEDRITLALLEQGIKKDDLTKHVNAGTVPTQFDFADYIEEAHNSSAYALIIPSTFTVIVLIVLALFGGATAYITHRPYAFYLPFLIVFIAIFSLCAIALKFYLHKFIGKESAPLPWLTVPRFSVSLQILLYLTCYSFSRLLFSPHFWAVAGSLPTFALFVGFVLLWLFVYFFVSWSISQVTEMLALPPHVNLKSMRYYLESMNYDLGDSDKTKIEQSQKPS